MSIFKGHLSTAFLQLFPQGPQGPQGLNIFKNVTDKSIVI